MLSSDVRLAFAAAKTYERLVRETVGDGRFAALGRPAFSALLIGTLVAICTTGRVTLGLVASTTACWMFVPAAQMLAGAAVIASAPRRPVDMARALDLFFAGHVPWSLWLLAVTAWSAVAGPPPPRVLSTALIAAAWTMAILFAFCKAVLGTEARGALARTAAHQALIWTSALAFVVLNVGGWARVLEVLRR